MEHKEHGVRGAEGMHSTKQGFFRMIANSVYSPDFYDEAPKRSVWEAVRYFIKLISLISFVMVAIPTIALAIGMFLRGEEESWLERAKHQVHDIFPQELVLRFNQGQVSVNVPEPYVIALPKAWQGRAVYDGTPIENLLVIDTKTSISADDFQKFASYIVLGKTQVGFLQADRGGIEIQDLSRFADKNFVVDKGIFSKILNVVETWIKIIAIIILIILPFILSLVFLLWYSIYLLFGALAIWLAAKVRQRTMTYSQAYKSGFYLMTAPILLSFLLPALFLFPFFFTLALFVMAMINFREGTLTKDQNQPNPGSAIEMPPSHS